MPRNGSTRPSGTYSICYLSRFCSVPVSSSVRSRTLRGDASSRPPAAAADIARAPLPLRRRPLLLPLHSRLRPCPPRQRPSSRRLRRRAQLCANVAAGACHDARRASGFDVAADTCRDHSLSCTPANATKLARSSPRSDAVGYFMSADIVVKVVMIGLLSPRSLTWTVWLAKTLELV